MKTLTLIILLLLIIPQSKGQDVMNPYILDAPIYYPYPSYPLINDLTIFPPSWATQNDPSFKWAHTGPSTGFSGEYEISLIRHPWNSFINIGGGAGLHVSYGMEIVSFPFTIDCAFTPPDECSSLSGTTDRFLYMPSAQYDTNNEAWGDLSNKFYQPIFLNNKDQSLVSRAFVKHVPMSLTTNGKVLPHTIIKHTVYVHCAVSTFSLPYPDDILYSFSWYYDNTRGRMRYYPFCNCNCSCNEAYYDISLPLCVSSHTS